MRVLALLALLALAAAVPDCLQCKQAANEQVLILHPEWVKNPKYTKHQCFVFEASAGYDKQCVCRCSNTDGVYDKGALLTCGKSHSHCTRCELPVNSGPECTACVEGEFVHEKKCIPTPACEENTAVTTEFALNEAGASHTGCENRDGKLVNKHGKDWSNDPTRYNRGDSSWNNAEDQDGSGDWDKCQFTSAVKPLKYKNNQPFHGYKTIKVQFKLENPYGNLEADETTTVEIRTCTDASATTCSAWTTAHDAETKDGTYTAKLGTNELDSIGANVWVAGELKTKHNYHGLEFTHGYVQTRVVLSLSNTKEISRAITTDIHSCQVESHWTSKYDTHSRGGCKASHCCATRGCGFSNRSRCCTRNCCHAWHTNTHTHTVRHEDKPGNLPGNHYGLQMHTKKGECSSKTTKKVFEVEEQAFHSLKIWGSC